MLVNYLKLLLAFLSAFWILWVKFPRLNKDQQLLEIQNWARNTLGVLNVRLHLPDRTQPSFLSSAPKLLVANHVSWVDALVIQALQPSIFVAKAEVQRWPVVGAIAAGCGVIFVKRASPSSARSMVDEVAQALHNGYHVACFPEGTTSDGLEVHPFHANLFESAIQNHVPVQPLTLRYTHPITQQHCKKAAFVGELGFVQSLHQVMTAGGIAVTVTACEAISPQGHSRKSLAQLAQLSVSTALAALSA